MRRPTSVCLLACASLAAAQESPPEFPLPPGLPPSWASSLSPPNKCAGHEDEDCSGVVAAGVPCETPLIALDPHNAADLTLADACFLSCGRCAAHALAANEGSCHNVLDNCADIFAMPGWPAPCIVDASALHGAIPPGITLGTLCPSFCHIECGDDSCPYALNGECDYRAPTPVAVPHGGMAVIPATPLCEGSTDASDCAHVPCEHEADGYCDTVHNVVRTTSDHSEVSPPACAIGTDLEDCGLCAVDNGIGRSIARDVAGCVNTYDIRENRRDDEGGYSCDRDFCPKCSNAGFCDRSCGYCEDPCIEPSDSEHRFQGRHPGFPKSALCDSNPCMNQGSCTNLGESFSCMCTGGWQGDICDRKLSCDDITELQGLMDAASVECCDQTDCSSGFPKTCSRRCAAMLLPMQLACANVLSNKLYTPINEAIVDAAARCPTEQDADPTTSRGTDNTCRYAGDGECDEPSTGTGACRPGIDSNDCARQNSCAHAHDGVCDEPAPWDGFTGLCEQGTDGEDCCAEHAHSVPPRRGGAAVCACNANYIVNDATQTCQPGSPSAAAWRQQCDARCDELEDNEAIQLCHDDCE